MTLTMTTDPRAVALRSTLRLVTGMRGHTSIRQQRRLVDLVMGAGPLSAGVEGSAGVLGSIPGLWLRPRDARPGALLFLHGGAYMVGSSRSHRRVVARLASRLRIPAFTPDYRLAPGNRFPAALDDALAAYEGLLACGHAPADVLVAGDSAGGGLALALAQRLRDTGRPLPAALGLLSPWLDMVPDVRGERAPVAGDPICLHEVLREAAVAYLGAASGEDPAASPLRGTLDGLPAIVAVSVSDEPLRGDCERLVERMPAVEHRQVQDAWHGFYMHVGMLTAAAETLDGFADGMAAHLRRPRVGVVGAGMSGLCMATRLREAGYADVVVHEKADEVGGTWRENRYPGLTCDVPSRFYQYSFAPNPEWSQIMACGSEILSYFKRYADERDLRRLIRFGSEVTAARWNGNSWQLTTADGHEDEVDVLVTATGFLHHPRFPDIDGLESFAGIMRHSSRWDPSIELGGKRVGVIGTGSTGVQLTSEISQQAGKLSLFQRTPQWVLTLPNRTYGPRTRFVYRRVPALNRLAYSGYRWVIEATLGIAAVRPGLRRELMAAYVRMCLRRGVKNPELRAKLTPDYRPLCKRIAVSGTFYNAVQQDNVELVTERIERVEPRGVITADGRLHELDVLILATGFDAHAYMRPMRIEGRDGVTLDHAWADGPTAYKTIMLPDFPNLFMLIGPHSPVGNQSIIGVAETQTRYVVRWLDFLGRNGVTAVSPRADVTEQYNAARRAAAPNTIAASGCSSWYIGPDGAVAIWPWTPDDHRAMLREPALDEFIVHEPTPNGNGRVRAGSIALR